MDGEKFTNTSITIKGLLGLIEAKDIAIPEIQRPFVWKKSQVRDLIDSLYKGYPTGYIILWKNPNVKLKDGTISSGKKVIIDGQQRITALMASVAGMKVFNSEFKDEIIEDTFKKMYDGVLNVISQHNFTQFMIAIKSAGFISEKMVNSNMALDFAYTIHLLLQESDVPVAERKRIVQKWYVLSVLTGRYSSSPESAFARDIRQITEVGVPAMLKSIEDAILSENFWNVAVPQDLTMTSTNNPTYLAANCIPKEVFDMGHAEYEVFLEKRRLLMAKKIRKYYEGL